MITYLKDHIKEEIEGAKDYMHKALEMKTKHPDFALKFYKMSEMEIEHATCLTKMFSKMDKPDDMTDAEYAAAQRSVIDDYVTSMSAIENMKKLFHE